MSRRQIYRILRTGRSLKFNYLKLVSNIKLPTFNLQIISDVDCGPLPGLEHGYVNLEDKRTTHGASAEYTCHENYTLIGREKRTCQDDGQWSNDQPQCLCKQY